MATNTLSLPLFEKNVDIITALPINPKPPVYPAATLQGEFDKAANLIKNYLNTEFHPALILWLNALSTKTDEKFTVADNRITTETNALYAYIALQLTDVYTAITNTTIGQIIDRSITLKKLVPNARKRNNFEESMRGGLL